MHHAAFSQHGSRALAQGPSQVNIESGLEACFAQLSILIFLSLKLFSVRDTYSRLNMAALGDEQVENNAAPTEVDSDSEVSCITGHLLESDGAVEIEEIVGPIWIPREYKQDTPIGEEDVPPPALDPLASEEDVSWYERDFMERAARDFEIEGPMQGCELPSILKQLFDARQDPDKNWGQFEGGILFLDPHQVEQLTPWLPNLRHLTPSEIQAARAAEDATPPPIMPSIDESAPLTERLAQLLEQMQPGFRRILYSRLVVSNTYFLCDV